MTTKDIELCSIDFKLSNGDVIATNTTNAIVLNTIVGMCKFVKVDPDCVEIGKLPIKKGLNNDET